MSVTLLKDSSVSLSLPNSNSSAQIHLFGATVTSWKCNGVEKLFLSNKSNLDGSAAIRGGIPIIFPVFGPTSDHQDLPKGKAMEGLPRHGFARDSFWILADGDDKIDDAQVDAKEKVSAAFVLKSTSDPTKFSSYKFPFTLIYTVTLTSSNLTTSLKVTHDSTPTSSSDTMPFQALLHNYIRVPSSSTSSIQGLKGLSYLDKTSSDKTQPKEFHSEILSTESKEIDSVFIGSSPDIKLSYKDEKNGGINVTRIGFKDTTIWNPAKEKSDGMKDMQQDGWKEFVCVEPGHVRGWVELKKGESWTGSQTLEAF